MEYKISYNQLEAIENALSKHKRIELIPTKDGVVILEIKRNKVNV